MHDNQACCLFNNYNLHDTIDFLLTAACEKHNTVHTSTLRGDVTQGTTPHQAAWGHEHEQWCHSARRTPQHEHRGEI
ncbi:hypothetical protein ElyMa_002100500 [Elysia marginata]|uniref:Uncharacterized protein n=1 Tax=Elysia marginata TaxID=1093978 RepID=A0AAV4FG23_9GAST|nr:hypothetical protein ElyMa_002100500 [Elysia marginata]